MLSKLTRQNVKRSFKDYLIYVVTMSFVAALMFAFNGMAFSKSMKAIVQDNSAFLFFIGAAGFFITMIIIWLVHYIIQFMLEKRSREFGTYLLLGMQKKQVATLFRRENMLLGLLSLLLGFLPGMLFQYAFMTIFYASVGENYQLALEFSPWNIVLTGGIFFIAYFLSLFRIKRKFKKMTIHKLLYMERQNEKIINEKQTWKQILSYCAVLYIIGFNMLTLTSHMHYPAVIGFVLGLVIAVYLLYMGLSSVFVAYLKKSNNASKSANLFIYRQLSSKLKTMSFTMGTLTILFTATLLSWMVVLMFMDYQNKAIDTNLPVDVMIYDDHPEEKFTKQIQLIEQNNTINQKLTYTIYTDQETTINNYLLHHLTGADSLGWDVYYDTDTYMGVTDYNAFLKLTGHAEKSLKADEFLINTKKRAVAPFNQFLKNNPIKIAGQTLKKKGIFQEPISQSGFNGADYIVVVPDKYLTKLTPFYAVLAVDIKGRAPKQLEEQLENIGEKTEKGFRQGSDMVISLANSVIVRDNSKSQARFMLNSMCFAFGYIGIVFFCTTLTILAIQQLSDASKYKQRYKTLAQLGLNKAEVDQVILKQLGLYFSCPFIISIILSMFIGLFASERFVYYTGIDAGNFQYYLISVGVFLFLYVIYFIVTYLGFKKNIRS